MSETFISLDLSSGSTSSRGRGAKSNGVWDDGELVRAYDAALEEFHIHHPGPGTWLDKVTAATTQGQPLPGASTFGTEWYKAPTNAGQKRKRIEPVEDNNPYKAPVNKAQSQRAASPVYAPPSPLPSESNDHPPARASDHLAAPALSLQSAAEITYDQAIAHAMSAQYAAGYWLGVAHAKAGAGAPAESNNAAKAPADSNILHTRREFGEKSTKLKR